MTDAGGEHLATVTPLFGDRSASAPRSWAGGAVDEGSPSAGSDDGLEVDDPVASDGRARSDGRFERISNVSMHALGRRGLSVDELRDRLLQRGFDEHEVAVELDRLESVGLLDDGELAETLVRTLRERKGLGRTALVAELKRRRLHPDAVEAALVELGDDDLELAVELARKRAPQLRSLPDDTARRRLGAFLMRKGYGGSVVAAAVDRALAPSGPRFR